MILIKRYWILISLIAVLLGGTLIYFGWSKQKSELPSSQPEQPKPEVIRQIMIPSSSDPKGIIVPFDPPSSDFWGGSKEEDHFLVKDFWELYFASPSPGEGLIEYASAIWSGKWIKRDGTEVHQITDVEPFILTLVVLEYEKYELAQEDYDRISTDQEFKETTLEGFRLRTKVSTPSWWEEELLPYIKPEQCQQYLLYSNNFVIYAFGLKEAAEDAMIRIIDRYAVE